MTKVTTKRLNDVVREVYADGEHVGWLTCIASGWIFTAADKRLMNRFPDSVEPTPTWQAALPADD
jgi:hypothetical protein